MCSSFFRYSIAHALLRHRLVLQIIVELRNIIGAVRVSEALMEIAIALFLRIRDRIAEMQVRDERAAGAERTCLRTGSDL